MMHCNVFTMRFILHHSSKAHTACLTCGVLTGYLLLIGLQSTVRTTYQADIDSPYHAHQIVLNIGIVVWMDSYNPVY